MAEADPYSVRDTGNAYLDSLIWGSRWDQTSGPITYEIWSAPDTQPWVTAEKAVIREAIASWTAVARIEMKERVGVQTDINLIKTDLDEGTYAGANGPNGEDADGLIAFDPSHFEDWRGQLQVGGFPYYAVVHEIGHALGLAHPHDNGGLSRLFPDVAFEEPGDTGRYGLNSGLYTVMSYNNYGQWWAPEDELGWGFVAGPMAFDIAAIQHIYGANLQHATGNNSYALPGANGAGTYYECIWDAAGSDRLVYSGSRDVVIDLRDAPLTGSKAGGYLSRVDGVLGGFTIANGVTIENALAGSGDDSLTGNEAANTLSGGAGADRMAGGGGNDVYLLNESGDRVLEATSGGIDQIRSSIDYTLGANVEGLRLFGSAVAAEGNESANLLAGNSKANLLEGAAGNDTLLGGAGADSLYGGTGIDVADFLGASTDLRVSLNSGTGRGGIAEGDRLRSIEGLAGGEGDDLLFGSPLANRLLGRGGDDSAYGNGGNDLLYGGAGEDRLDGGADDDTLDGWTGRDRLYAGDGEDRLAGGNENDVAYGGDGEDRLYGGSGVDGLWGGDDADLLYGGNDKDRLSGDTGHDRLQGEAGDDTVYGGAGNDTLQGQTGDDLLHGGTGKDVFIVRTSGGTDTIWDFAPGEDRLDLTSFDFANASAVRAIAQLSGGRLLLDLPGTAGGTVLLRGLDAVDDLQAGDLIL
jgi:serralysin